MSNTNNWQNGLPVGYPIAFYRSGIRQPDGGEPATVARRDTNGILGVTVIQPGTNEGKQTCRHVDDPYFETFPARRQDGVWDFIEGYPYPQVKPQDVEVSIDDTVMQLHAEGADAGAIAAKLHVKGLDAAAVRKITEKYSTKKAS